MVWMYLLSVTIALMLLCKVLNLLTVCYVTVLQWVTLFSVTPKFYTKV